jgi:hypothetical protein
MKNKQKDITFHYTNEQMVKDLLRITPLTDGDIVLDAGSGRNKVWFNNLDGRGIYKKLECEIEDGVDFLTDWNKNVDWVIGNPPFHLGWMFLDKASAVAKKGVAFLGNLNFLNSCLPSRLEILKERGFYLNKIHVVQDKRWFGRYYFLIFTKEVNSFISWNKKSY